MIKTKALAWIVLLFVVPCIFSCATFKTSRDLVPKNRKIFSGTYQQVFDRATIVMHQLGWHILDYDEETGIIQAKTPFSLWTTGDLVTAEVKEIEPGQILVEISSASRQKYDWGKNARNINAFYEGMAIKGISVNEKKE